MPDKARGEKKNSNPLVKAAEILESISDGFFALDCNWRITYINQQGAAFLGLKPVDLIGQSVWKMYPHLIGTLAEDNFRKAMQEGKPREFEIPSPETGNWFNIRVFPSKEGISVLWQDITGHKQFEIALKESDEKYNQLFSNIGEGVAFCEIIFDSEGKPADTLFLKLNDACQEVMGMPPGKVEGKRASDFGPIDKLLLRKFGQVALTGKQSSFEHYGEKTQRWYEVRIYSPQKGYVVVLFQNITARKQAEQALAKAKNELETKVKDRTQELLQANTQLKQYANKIMQVQEEERKRIAYELHDDTAQYLSILKMQIGALAESAEIQSPKLKERLQFLEKDADRAFNDVRRYSHELRPTVLEHQGLAAALEQIATDYNKLGQLSVEVNVEGMEPELSEEVKLGFFRIAQEALNNARKHAKASQVNTEIRFNHKQLKMTVTDNGEGFNAKEALKTRGGKGSLGLVSMKERADLINADLKIVSEPGKGTQVILKAKL